MDLIYTNSRTYNGDEHQYTVKAKEIMDAAKETIAEVCVFFSIHCIYTYLRHPCFCGGHSSFFPTRMLMDQYIIPN